VKLTVLIISTARWFTTARLGIAFANSGCDVEAVCPTSHPLCVTKAVRRTHVYHALTPVDSLLRAVRACTPDLVVPGDDLATKHLQDLYYSEKRKNEQSSKKICELIVRSIGSPESFPIVIGRASFIELARQENIRVPKTVVVRNDGDLEAWISECGFPVVLKSDGTSSGEGVRITHTLPETKRAFHALQSPPPLIRVAKRVLIGRDLRWIRPTLERRRSVVNAQEFVEGRDVTSLVACWQGEILSTLHFEVIVKQYERGPASVLRLIENHEIDITARKVVGKLNISGLHGFDFLLEKGTENPYLIEMNPRATQVGHLAMGPGHDLIASLTAALSGNPNPNFQTMTANPMIALFPQEWSRDPNSALLSTAYHDIPWGEPELIRDCLRKTRNWKDSRSVNDWFYILSTQRSSTI
jgi:Carbamoyl-phosphate synthase L chain, ATP binding domain